MRLFLLSPSVVFAARVNEPAGVLYPLDAIDFDGVTTGAYTDILPGQTIIFGSAAGFDDLGRQRVRKAPTASELFIGRSSQGIRDGEVNIADNDYITVLDDYRVWSKIPFFDINGGQYKDSDLAYVDQTLEPPPVANCGPGTAGTIDPADDLLDVAFSASASIAVADGATITGWAWNLGDGNVIAGASNAQDVTAEFPAGFRWVALTVQDSNGKTHTARCPVLAIDPDADPTIQAFEIVNHRITPQGQQLGVRVREDISLASYPDGTLVLLWDGEPADEDDRSHMQFIGWIQQEPVDQAAQRTGFLQDVTLNCVDVAGRLATLPGFPQIIENEDAPENWSQMNAPNIDKYLHYLLHWHSTALEVADWTWSGTGDDYEFQALASDGQSLFDQVEQRAGAIVPDRHFTCNRRGQLKTVADPMLQNTADRTATEQATIALADWSGVRYERTRPPRVYWLRGSAIKAQSVPEIEVFFCESPGHTPGQGDQEMTHGEQLAISQDDLNAVTGHRYARLNAPQSKFTVTLAVGFDLGMEPADMTWVRLVVGAAQRTPGVTFNTRGLVAELNIRYDHQRTGLVKTVEMVWERETSDTPAVTAVTVTPDVAEPVEPDDWWVPPEPVVDQTTLGLKTVYVMDKTNLYRTLDFDSGSPTWVNIGPTPLTGELFKDFVLDPWRPATTGFLASDQGVHRSSNLNAPTPTWTHVLDEAAIIAATGDDSDTLSWAKLLASSVADGFLSYFYVSNLTKLYCARSSDRGATWAHVQTMPTSTFFLATEAGAVDIVPHTVGGQLVFYVANGFTDKLHVSTDSGATWGEAGAFPDSVGPPTVVHCPWADNEDGQTVYVGFRRHGSLTPMGRLYKSTDGGATFTTISPITDRGTVVRRTAIEASLLDSQALYCMVERISGDAGHTLWLSDDGGTSWAQATATGYDATQTPAATSGFPYSTGRLYLLHPQNVLVSADRGATFVSKLGTGITTPMSFASAGLGTIVPDWTI